MNGSKKHLIWFWDHGTEMSEVARKAGFCSNTVLIQMLKHQNPALKSIRKIAAAVGCSVAEVIEGLFSENLENLK